MGNAEVTTGNQQVTIYTKTGGFGIAPDFVSADVMIVPNGPESIVARYRSIATDAQGKLVVELAPGSYRVSAQTTTNGTPISGHQTITVAPPSSLSWMDGVATFAALPPANTFTILMNDTKQDANVPFKVWLSNMLPDNQTGRYVLMAMVLGLVAFIIYKRRK
jgi:hypothetical protein